MTFFLNFPDFCLTSSLPKTSYLVIEIWPIYSPGPQGRYLEAPRPMLPCVTLCPLITVKILEMKGLIYPTKSKYPKQELTQATASAHNLYRCKHNFCTTTHLVIWCNVTTNWIQREWTKGAGLYTILTSKMMNFSDFRLIYPYYHVYHAVSFKSETESKRLETQER